MSEKTARASLASELDATISKAEANRLELRVAEKRNMELSAAQTALDSEVQRLRICMLVLEGSPMDTAALYAEANRLNESRKIKLKEQGCL